MRNLFILTAVTLCLSVLADDVSRHWGAYKKALRGKDYPAAVEALRKLAQTNTKKAADKILRLAEDEGIPQEVYEGALEALGIFSSEDVLSYIAEKALSKRTNKPLRISLARALPNAPSEKVFQMLIRFLEDEEPAVVREAIEALKVRGDARAVDALIALVERVEETKGLEWEAAQHALRELTNCDKDLIAAIDWRNWWNGRGKKPVPKKRPDEKIGKLKKKLAETTVTLGMNDAPLKDVVDVLSKISGVRIVIDEGVNENSPVTLQAKDMPLVEALRLLIEQADIDYKVKKDGVHIVKFVPKKREEGRILEKFRTDAPTFFGSEITSKRVIFILDVSGSMAEGSPPRIELVKKELKSVIEKLSPAVKFNIIAFGSKVLVWSRKKMVKATDAAKKKAKKFVDSFEASGLTHTDEALKAAFAVEDVDTIYLLSDGAPYRAEHGESLSISFIESILEWTAKANRFRRIRIHTLGFEEIAGQQGGQICVDFLKRLAEDSGGRFTNIK